MKRFEKLCMAFVMMGLGWAGPVAAQEIGGWPLVQGYLQVEPQWRWLSDQASEGTPELGSRFEAELAVSWLPVPELKVGLDVAGVTAKPAAGEVSEGRSELAFYEAYLSAQPIPELTLTVGKRRVPWGVGFVSRPADLVNPVASSLEPSLLREGAYLAGAQWGWSWGSAELVWRAAVEESEHGIPDDVAWEEEQQLWAARFAATLWESDFSLVAYRQGTHWRGGATAVTFLNADIELHGEVLVKDDSALPLPGAPTQLVALLGRDDQTVSLDALVGARYSNAENGLDVTMEYQFLGAGLQEDEFDSLMQLRQGVGLDSAATLSLTSTRSGMPSLRRHYLTMAVRRVVTTSNWMPQLTVRYGPEDSGVVLFPSVEYRLNDQATLMAGAFIMLGPDESEFRQSPLDAMAFGRMTVYF